MNISLILIYFFGGTFLVFITFCLLAKKLNQESKRWQVLMEVWRDE